MRRTVQAAAALCSCKVVAFVAPTAPAAALRRMPASTIAHRQPCPPLAVEQTEADLGVEVTLDEERVAVLFDFDGTIGDTETPAMEVAYWELAPYFPSSASESAWHRM